MEPEKNEKNPNNKEVPNADRYTDIHLRRIGIFPAEVLFYI